MIKSGIGCGPAFSRVALFPRSSFPTFPVDEMLMKTTLNRQQNRRNVDRLGTCFR